MVLEACFNGDANGANRIYSAWIKVNGVQVVNETGKTRRFGKVMGRTQDIKKAYVRLAPGQTIDYEAKLKA